ncbi:MAG: pyruvate:ferredoxin (flavodoxin) oxidoreductase [Phycisphaera sp.]|nr:pyruvate:ferredoxin (flavodoxin) oxidoreductase [Phycisphaera sp.]
MTTWTVDANEAAASVAYRTNEVIAIYPITPASPMGEHADEWAVQRQPNLWGQVPTVVEMQSEGGAAGAVHGSLQAGALTTTFTASQGLLLMLPNMYKIAGELTPFVMHVAARTVATHALSIFGDHSDVMAARQTGFAMLCSSNVQEAHDFAAIAQAATLRSRVPAMHFFDGFRTSHEIGKITPLGDDDLRVMFDNELIDAHRRRALTPDRPAVRGTAQNPDVFFQCREACNPFYDACPDAYTDAMARFEQITGRIYRPYEYTGHPDADRVIVIMGSAAQTTIEAVEYLVAQGETVGVLNVRLFRPFAAQMLINALPSAVQQIAVLDRTKEPGGVGEPLYLDVQAAIAESHNHFARFYGPPRVVSGRYGLSGKEYTPAMAKAVFDELARDEPRRHFTVGITDDVTHLSLDVPDNLDTEDDDVVRAVFYGLGADGTVGANKNSIKIIGDNTDQHVQGYFVYDSKKSGARTVSHLRFGPRPIRSAYLIRRAGFVAVHQFAFFDQFDVLATAADGATLLINSPYGPDEVWAQLPVEAQRQIIERHLAVYVIDAQRVAEGVGLGRRINTIMQVCFFALAKVMPVDDAIGAIKDAIRKTYGRKGDVVVQRNLDAVDRALAELHGVNVPSEVTSQHHRRPTVPDAAPDFVQRVTSIMMAGHGDGLPVSAFPPDGTWPTGTSRWEKRDIALEIPIWDPDVCIQCNKCAFVCPHAAIRAAAYEADALDGAPDGFKSADYKAPDLRGLKYTIQVAPHDCTGCGLCVNVCPAKDKSNPQHKAIDMSPHAEHADEQGRLYEHFLSIPPIRRDRVVRLDVKGSQFFEPLFEYSGACAGCGETPYIKALTQLFGDRLLVANATGCSSIYGGNLPTTPWCANADGLGPAWSNSLFEDNAEFGYGMRLAVDHKLDHATDLLDGLADRVGPDLVRAIYDADQHSETGVAAARRSVAELRDKLRNIDSDDARELDRIADYLLRKSVWLIGGDGWAYDIGYGGLDHVLASGRDVNVLVLDTEVYSNTGGQSSKATPLGAAAKFAIAGKDVNKKDLGLMAMSYGNVYIASVAFGAKDNQTVRALLEAESYPGPSLVIAYSHCIAHGYDLRGGVDQQKLAVNSGVWPLYRFDPRRIAEGKAPLQLDSPPIKASVTQYMANEARFRMVEKMDPLRFKRLAKQAARHTADRVELYRQMSQLHWSAANATGTTNVGEVEHATAATPDEDS